MCGCVILVLIRLRVGRPEISRQLSRGEMVVARPNILPSRKFIVNTSCVTSFILSLVGEILTQQCPTTREICLYLDCYSFQKNPAQ